MVPGIVPIAVGIYPGPPMKVDFYYPPSPPEGAGEAAIEAASHGYDGFFTAETQYDPFLPLALAGAAQPGLDLGTAIAVAFPRSPMVTAMTAWDLARMSGGRFILGLGTQVRAHIVRRFSTTWDHPTPRLREYIQALRTIWASFQGSASLSFEGEFYRFSLITPFFNPGPIRYPEIPVFIAGVGPHLSRLAGEMCQGFHVHPFHTIRYLDEVVIPSIGDGAARMGRTIDDVEVATTVFVMTGATESEVEQAMEAVRQQIAFYASTPSYLPVLEAEGWDFGAELNAMSKRGEWQEMAALVPDEAVLTVGVATPIDQLARAIQDRYADRVQRIGFYTIGPTALNTDREALREVIASLKR
jgi:probable F420-dependent oxidoreductase